MAKHPLDPLLKPASVALLGASARVGSRGYTLAEMVINSAFEGEVYPINPGYDSILGKTCYANLDSLPTRVDHVVIALASEHLQTALADAIKHGAKAATIYSGTTLANDREPNLQSRLHRMAQQAGLRICGANGMGFYNVRDDFYAGIFPRPKLVAKGGISFIAQSGTVFGTFAHNGCQLGYNLCVSSGNEMTTNAADYIDWSLEQADTRVIGLFLETVRDPAAFVAALQKSNQKKIPVVVLKIGKSALAAKMALSHTGAIAGNHAAFAALLKRYGVIEVNDFDEMAATLMLLQTGRSVGQGDFAGAFESGGLREFIVDQSADLGIEFAAISDQTVDQLTNNLDAGLKPENPLDAWGTHDRFEQRFLACFNALMSDDNVGAGAFFSIFRDDYYLHEAIYRAVEAASAATTKPVALISTYSDVANDKMAQRAFTAGIPLIKGARQGLLAFKHLFDYQHFCNRAPQESNQTSFDPQTIAADRSTINSYANNEIGEEQALRLLSHYAVPVVEHQLVSNETELIDSANRIGFPLVLKTAVAGINHKSDSQGVFIDIANEDQLRLHYADLCQRLGAEALLSKMIDSGIEIGLGTVNDSQFGPIIMVAAGGVLIELLSDRSISLCPVSESEAEAMLASLKISKLIDGLRGRPAANRKALIDTIVQLSRVAYDLRDCIAEIDINPLLLDESAVVAVDALIIRKPVNSTAC